MPSQYIDRSGSMFSYGCLPSLGTGGIITMYIDLGIRHYKWTNSMNTTSGIINRYTGFGVGFNLK